MASDPDIPFEECRARVEKAQLLIHKNGLEALLLSQWEHVYYFTGFMGMEAWCCKNIPHAVLIRRSGDPILILPEDLRPVASGTAWTNELRTYGTPTDFPAVVKDTLAALGSGRIGCELGNSNRMTCMPVDTFMYLSKSLRNEFVDCAGLVWELRMVKSRNEVDRVRTAAKAASRAADRAFGELRDGMSEREFARIVSKFMIEEGADRPLLVVCQSGDKIRRGLNGIFPGERKIRAGEYVDIDFMAVYRQYVCDLNRFAYFGGQPPADDLDRYQLYAEANRRATEAVRPGMRVSEVFAAEARPFEELGIKGELADLGGHGLGLEVHEWPEITPENDTILRPGMLLSIEPYDPHAVIPGSHVGFVCEDNVAVTEDGHERLSTISRELRII